MLAIREHQRMFGLLAGAVAIVASAARVGAQTPAPIAWPMAGADIHNSHAALSRPSPQQLRTATVPGLKVKWSLTTTGDVSATPSVEPGGLYVPDWGGTLYKIAPDTGAIIWQHKISEYTGDAHSVSRTTPAISGNAIVIGDQSIARVIAVDKNTGQLLWSTRVHDDGNAMVTSSATIYKGKVYVGTVSREETRRPGTGQPAPIFRGSVVALDLATGAILWTFTTVPDGYTGGAVVPAPVVDEKRGSLYVASDNNYTIPDTVEQCVDNAGTSTDGQLACLDPMDFVDAVLALDLNTGALKWSRRFQGADTWTTNCNTSAGCDQPPGLDFDFGSSPNLLKVANFTGVPDDLGGTSAGWMLGIGQKSGVYRAINPDNGGVFWTKLVGLGGIQWGTAVDLDVQNAIYVPIKNDAHKQNTLTDFYGRQKVWNAGSWNKLDAATGNMIWSVPAVGMDLVNPRYGAAAAAGVMFTNYVVFGGDSAGYMTALDARTGRVLWSFFAGGTIQSTPAVFNDVVYWGAGYARLGVGNPKLYAFSFQ